MCTSINLLCCQSLDHIGFNHHDTACMLTCYEYNSCIYYSYSSDQCSLCIHDDDDLFTSGELQIGTDFQYSIHLKQDASLAFRNEFCSVVHPEVPDEIRFNHTEGSITEVDVCYSSLYGRYSGLTLYSNGLWLGDYGACAYHKDHYHTVTWLLDPGEMILRVVYYFGVVSDWDGTYILRDLELHTDRSTYGPASGDGGEVFEDKGYNFLGFVGWGGHLVNRVGSNFQRC